MHYSFPINDAAYTGLTSIDAGKPELCGRSCYSVVSAVEVELDPVDSLQPLHGALITFKHDVNSLLILYAQILFSGFVA